ncbi:MAG: T9SS type A sorting domain-containing protein [Ignavibacteriaceae bacterium]|nr:T9SS type A sorting domain-containing protein [Ignavibacteriaceae bacterium]
MNCIWHSKNLVNVLLLSTIISAVVLYARENGVVGKTLKNGSGCTCHNAAISENVIVSISGPDTLAAGQTATYTLTIEGGPLNAGGTNIAASEGDLLPISSDLRKESNELTHVLPKSPISGTVTFQFNYTAPLTTGQQTIFANGNSVNLNGANTGDQWNFASNKTITVIQPTSINDEIQISLFELFQNYPNPFNPTTKINWRSSVSGRQVLKVYDVIGNEVTTLLDKEIEAGYHSIDFNANELPGGVYLYRIQVENFIETKKMILLR